jgi:putative transposase
MDKFQNKYRIASSRATFWDYGSNAAYFETICTKNRLCWFGNVIDKRMQLSAIGHIANSCWYEIPNHFPFIELGAHIIMPNHVHDIVIINKPNDDINMVEAQNFAPLPSQIK